MAPPDLLLWSLRGLTAIDPQITTEQGEGRVRLSLGDRLVLQRALPVPPQRAPPTVLAAQMAEELSQFEQAAWTVSAPLQAAGAQRVLQSGFEELFNHLDPYSRYVTAAEARRARERRVGQAGLGLRIAAGRAESVVVAAVAPGSPAATAGLRIGDRLLAIDGQPVSANDLSDAAARLEGPEDSEAVLAVQRGNRRRQLVLRRSPVPPETVTAERLENLLWLRISGFSNATDNQVAAALTTGFATEPQPAGVVLDLRGNRGGLLSQAVAVAELFLPGGEVARSGGRHPESRRIYIGSGPDLAEGRPVVVLVDGRSASAAEIVAGALADRRRAAAVGSVTQGKGLIQLVYPLPNGAELLLSWSRVLMPSGWPIQGVGVLPGLCTSLGAETMASQLAALRSGARPMGAALARERALRPPVPDAEVAALRATCPPAEGREADRAAARALLEDSTAWRSALPP